MSVERQPYLSLWDIIKPGDLMILTVSSLILINRISDFFLIVEGTVHLFGKFQGKLNSLFALDW